MEYQRVNGQLIKLNSYGNYMIADDIQKGLSEAEIIKKITDRYSNISDAQAKRIYDAVKQGGSVFVRHTSNTAMVTVVVQHGGETLSTGRIEADAQSDALTLTKRFCAKQGIDIVVVEGQVRQIGQISGSWKLAEGASTAAGGSIVWSS